MTETAEGRLLEKRTTLYLPEELHTAAKVMAARKGTSMTLLLREALAEKLARLEREPVREERDGNPRTL